MYKLDLENLSKKIIKQKAKKVLIQLPDGLKKKAEEISYFLEKKTKSKIFIWLGNCFGGCDIPFQIKSLGIDLIVQFGHARYFKEREW
ncbi:MAG: diphthamide synthesis protein [Candidatus Pacearchaeota archaeon]